MKKESTIKLKKKNDVMSQQCTLVAQSRGRINEMEAHTKYDKDRVAAYTNDTSN